MMMSCSTEHDIMLQTPAVLLAATAAARPAATARRRSHPTRRTAPPAEWFTGAVGRPTPRPTPRPRPRACGSAAGRCVACAADGPLMWFCAIRRRSGAGSVCRRVCWAFKAQSNTKKRPNQIHVTPPNPPGERFGGNRSGGAANAPRSSRTVQCHGVPLVSFTHLGDKRHCECCTAFRMPTNTGAPYTTATRRVVGAVRCNFRVKLFGVGSFDVVVRFRKRACSGEVLTAVDDAHNCADVEAPARLELCGCAARLLIAEQCFRRA